MDTVFTYFNSTFVPTIYISTFEHPYNGDLYKVLPLQNGGGAEKVVAILVLTWELEVLAILKGTQNVSTLLKEGARNVLPCFEGGVTSFGPAIFPFCSHPPPRY